MLLIILYSVAVGAEIRITIIIIIKKVKNLNKLFGILILHRDDYYGWY